MGLADTVTKAYMKDNFVFADAFTIFLGRSFSSNSISSMKTPMETR